MNLHEYLCSNERNLWWRLSSGEQLNLLDEAVDEIERLKGQRADVADLCRQLWRLTARLLRALHAGNSGQRQVAEDVAEKCLKCLGAKET